MRLLGALLVWLALATPALADELRPSSIELSEQEPGRWHLGWKQNLGQSTPDALRVPAFPDNCRTTAAPVQRRGAAALVGTVELACEGPVAGGAIGWPDLVGEDALVRVIARDGTLQTFVLTPADPVATIAPRPGRWQVFTSYFSLGVVHILEGWDHLLFVIALVLLVVRGWAVIKAATAFTIAHSLTLAAVTVGFIGLPARPVEAAIALSIVFLAVELARGDRDSLTRRLPWAVAFAFGLLHGFGFAGALRDIGLPQGEVPTALLAFNLGVEAGQLLVIAAVVAIRLAVSRLVPRAEMPAVRVATYAIGITASFWLIERLVA